MIEEGAEVRVRIPVLVEENGGRIDGRTGRGLRRLCLEGLLFLRRRVNNNFNSSSNFSSNFEQEQEEHQEEEQEQEQEKKKKIGMIVSHPYGPVGGNMYNHVVKYFCEYGHNVLKLDATLRYNNRGIGNSEGRGSWRGDAEFLDLLGCCEFLHTKYGIMDFLLIGYSYGSIFSSSLTARDLNDYLYRIHYSLIPTKIAADDVSIEKQQEHGGKPKQDYCNILGYTTIAYPFGVHWALTLFNKSFLQKTRNITGIPRLFLFGDKDEFTSLNGIEKMINSLVDDSLTNVYILGGGGGGGYDHFFADKEKLARLIECFEYWLSQNNLLVLGFISKEESRIKKEERMIINFSEQHSSSFLKQKMKIQHNQMTILYIN